MKVWTNSMKGEDKIIAHVDDMIYKCNPKASEIDSVVWSLNQNIPPTQNMFAIPVSYIQEIRWQEGNKYLQVFFRGSEEHLIVLDDSRRKEMYDYFRNTIPDFFNTTDYYTKIEAAKKPLIALGVLAALFLPTLYMAAKMEATGGMEAFSTRGIFTVILALAALGTIKVVLIFGSLLAITGVSIVRKMKQPPVIHRLIKTIKKPVVN
ncbi:hypothetical protein DVR12_22855 [Chitinophaga silvatica]|uniref:Uncharacterized protein n=1 Tax=Chitinophaga silvatica TaxID=2282649 RepID=A0A3E1Y4T5_9BACT|nr:hypothetical protein [Chitinophaga silvatica]RFS19477.1 hypothetical protein DVR12_22855 [Chitinophaga silvatica]